MTVNGFTSSGFFVFLIPLFSFVIASDAGAAANRIAIGTGRDLVLNPPQSGEPLNYFMYPYAEADGMPLNEDLFGFNIGYTIRFKEL
jgi:hypothetical protein